MGFIASALAGLFAMKKAAPKASVVPEAPAAPAANPQNTQEQVINTDRTGVVLKRKARGKRSLMISLGNNSGGGSGAGLNI